MTGLERIITELMRSVKQNPSFEDIRFINAYNSQIAEKPVEGMLAVVEMAGFDSVLKLNIRLIGGSGITGSQLGYTAIEIAAALREADTEKYIDSVYLSETKYDKSIIAFYRDIKLSLSPAVGGFGDERAIALSINSEAVSGVKAVRWEEKTEGVSLYEFNRGEPYAVINGKSYYEITVAMKTLSFTGFENGFTLSAENGGYAVAFLNCVINRISTAADTNGQIVYTLKILSTEKVTA